MTIYGSNRRGKGRAKRELGVQLRSANEVKQVYTVDFSTGGVKVAGAMLRLAVGQTVELLVEKNGSRLSFSGQVARVDGMHRINRIGRDGCAFFIRILEEKFIAYVKANFTV